MSYYITGFIDDGQVSSMVLWLRDCKGTEWILLPRASSVICISQHYDMTDEECCQVLRNVTKLLL